MSQNGNGPGYAPGHRGRVESEREGAMAVGEGGPGTALHLRERRQASRRDGERNGHGEWPAHLGPEGVESSFLEVW